jgi:hypothetical protein
MHIPPAPGDGELQARGVHRAKYTVQGYPALVAIASWGDAIKHFKLEPYTDELLAWLAMWRFLERHDPVKEPERPALRVVPANMPATLPASVTLGTPLHPCHRETQLDVTLRQMKRNVHRLGREQQLGSSEDSPGR